MVDIQKQIAYWKEGAREDLAVARQLVDSRRTRHGLFFAHLALEKMLKALFCKNNGDLAPRIHNLSRLADVAGLDLPAERLDVLAEMNAFQVEGRYPESLRPAPIQEEALLYMERAEGAFEWLMKQL